MERGNYARKYSELSFLYALALFLPFTSSQLPPVKQYLMWALNTLPVTFLINTFLFLLIMEILTEEEPEQ